MVNQDIEYFSADIVSWLESRARAPAGEVSSIDSDTSSSSLHETTTTHTQQAHPSVVFKHIHVPASPSLTRRKLELEVEEEANRPATYFCLQSIHIPRYTDEESNICGGASTPSSNLVIQLQEQPQLKVDPVTERLERERSKYVHKVLHRRRKDPHAVILPSPFSPLRNRAPSQVWSALPKNLHGNCTLKRFRTQLADMHDEPRSRYCCDYEGMPDYPLHFLYSTRHCVDCKRDNLGKKLLGMRYRQVRGFEQRETEDDRDRERQFQDTFSPEVMNRNFRLRARMSGFTIYAT